eukprot:5150676-Pleurochrysis_carterae.AAC.1
MSNRAVQPRKMKTSRTTLQLWSNTSSRLSVRRGPSPASRVQSCNPSLLSQLGQRDRGRRLPSSPRVTNT